MSDTDRTEAGKTEASSVRASFAVIADELARLLNRLGPSEEAQAHFKQAHVEFLKGVRKVIDERIEGLSKARTKGTSIKVE